MKLAPVSIDNPEAVFAKALVERTGLHRYVAIMEYSGNVADEESGFQTLFNGYYNVRRSADWRKAFYGLFQEIRITGNSSYERILCELHERTGRVEPSFASKMFATVDDTQPVWDRRVVSALKRLDPSLTIAFSSTVGGRIKEALNGYQALAKTCRDLLERPVGQSCVNRFDVWLGDYSHTSDMKKLDVVLWCAGS